MDGSLHQRTRTRVKGAALREFFAFYVGRYGAKELVAATDKWPHAWLRHLDVEDDALGLLASRWYDSEPVNALLDVIAARHHGVGRQALIRDGAEAVMGATLGGVYRALFRWMASPERYARFANELWRSYYDNGMLEVETLASHRARSKIWDWEGHHPLACELYTAGGVAIYEGMGCEGVYVQREQCVSDGHEYCSFVTSWRRT